MPATETKIWMALRSRVETLPLAFAKAWPAQTFTPIANQPFIEVRLLPNAVQRLFIGSDDPHRRPGILQLSLMYPISLGHAFEVINQYAGQIAAHWPTDLKMTFQDTTVRVERAPDVAQPFRDETYWRVPCSIRYEAFA